MDTNAAMEAMTPREQADFTKEFLQTFEDAQSDSATRDQSRAEIAAVVRAKPKELENVNYFERPLSFERSENELRAVVQTRELRRPPEFMRPDDGGFGFGPKDAAVDKPRIEAPPTPPPYFEEGTDTVFVVNGPEKYIGDVSKHLGIDSESKKVA